MERTERCPLCGALSLNGDPCDREAGGCEVGNLHHAGIHYEPITDAAIYTPEPDHSRLPDAYCAVREKW